MYEEVLEKYKINGNQGNIEIAKELIRTRDRKQSILDDANNLERIKVLRNELEILDEAINHFNTIVDIGFTGITRNVQPLTGAETDSEEESEVEEVEAEPEKLPSAPEDLYKLGKNYENKKDYKNAVKCFMQASQQGHPDSTLEMFKYYFSGEAYGVDVEKKQASEIEKIAKRNLQILEQKADELNAKDRDSNEAIQASLNIGMRYFNGVDCGPSALIGRRQCKDYYKAEKYLQYLAEEKEIPEALYICAFIAEYGKENPNNPSQNREFGVVDSERAIILAEKAANKGMAAAQWLLGNIYLHGGIRRKH